VIGLERRGNTRVGQNQFGTLDELGSVCRAAQYDGDGAACFRFETYCSKVAGFHYARKQGG
jgi:hypothetical protein